MDERTQFIARVLADEDAMTVLLRRAGAALPERLLALLEVESDRISLLP